MKRSPVTVRGLYFYLIKFSVRRTFPRYAERSATSIQMCLTHDRRPPSHQVMRFVPIRLVSPMLGQTEDRQSALAERSLFNITFCEFVLRDDRPSTFFSQH